MWLHSVSEDLIPVMWANSCFLPSFTLWPFLFLEGSFVLMKSWPPEYFPYAQYPPETTRHEEEMV